MSYKDFTLDKLSKTFGLTIESKADLVAAMVQPIKLDEFFLRSLNYSVPLGLTINTEKARSEMIIAPILLEFKKQVQVPISLFSGTEFNVDAEKGLNGFCDFVVSLSPQQLYISAPALIIIEAKKENIIEGLGQCIAAMVAAQLFNQREGNAIDRIYGTVTTGNQWKFVQLDGSVASVDLNDYYIDRLEEIFSILVSMSQPQ